MYCVGYYDIAIMYTCTPEYILEIKSKKKEYANLIWQDKVPF